MTLKLSAVERARLRDRIKLRCVVDANGCWIFSGAKNRKGYGMMGAASYVVMLAHRLSWIVHNCPIPEGLCVLHRCDTPACCNPAHLFLGSKADNNADMTTKRRNKRGEEHWKVRFTVDQIRDIKRRFAAGESAKEIATLFDARDTYIHAIVRGERWAHVN